MIFLFFEKSKRGFMIYFPLFKPNPLWPQGFPKRKTHTCTFNPKTGQKCVCKEGASPSVDLPCGRQIPPVKHRHPL